MSVTYRRYARTIADRERCVVAAWLDQLPAAGWTGTAGELAAEFGLVAEVLGPSYPAPTASTAARRLLGLSPTGGGWVVEQKRTNAARLIQVRSAGDGDGAA